METRNDFLNYLNSHNVEYKQDITDEELRKIVLEHIQKYAQSS